MYDSWCHYVRVLTAKCNHAILVATVTDILSGQAIEPQRTTPCSRNMIQRINAAPLDENPTSKSDTIADNSRRPIRSCVNSVTRS